MSTTRFNPTVNGLLHIGHIYTALVNQAEGDRFLLRFDDNHRHWTLKLGPEKIEQLLEEQLKDLAWMGIEPDGIYRQSDHELQFVNVVAWIPHYWPGVDPPTRKTEPEIISDPPIIPFGTDFHVTAERAWLDSLNSVDLVIRGSEWLVEHHLYLYFCTVFGLIPPRMVYLPRLMGEDGREISKTHGSYRICALREVGYTPDSVLAILRQACLKDTVGDWRVENIHGRPSLPTNAFGEVSV